MFLHYPPKIRENSKLTDIISLSGEQTAAEAQFIGDRFARWAVLDEMFQRRVAVLNGRFRVDIMPGSTVQFDTMGVNIDNLPFAGAYSGRLQGTVNQVTLTLDAETATASTTLMLSHLRNESEIASESFSPIRHPVFNQEWRGGDFVPEGDLSIVNGEHVFTKNTLSLISLFNDIKPIPSEEEQRLRGQSLVSEKLAEASVSLFDVPAG